MRFVSQSHRTGFVIPALLIAAELYNLFFPVSFFEFKPYPLKKIMCSDSLNYWSETALLQQDQQDIRFYKMTEIENSTLWFNDDISKTVIENNCKQQPR